VHLQPAVCDSTYRWWAREQLRILPGGRSAIVVVHHLQPDGHTRDDCPVWRSGTVTGNDRGDMAWDPARVRAP